MSMATGSRTAGILLTVRRQIRRIRWATIFSRWGKCVTDYFSKPIVRKSFKWFCFDDSKTMEEDRVSGGILTRSYEEDLSDYPQWEKIAQDVVKQVYG